MKYFRHLLLTLFIIGAGALQSQAQVGITAVPFLQIEPDSRAAGMGNTGVAIADNASAIFWNPAGLAFQRGNQISITHSKWLPNFNTDLFYDYLVGKYYFEDIGTIGGHITFLNLGEQERTDETGEPLGTFSSYEVAGGASYGFELNKHFAVGTGFRFIYSKLVPSGLQVGGQEARAGTSIGLDLAGMYKSGPINLLNREAQINAGLNLSNIGPGVQYTDRKQQDPLPTLLRVGAAFTMDLDAEGYNTLTLASDVSKIMARNDTTGNADGVLKAMVSSWDTFTRFNGSEYVDVSLAEQLMVGLGLEYWYDQKFALRSGYYYESPKNGNREFITLGAGIRYNIFGVDFSYIYTINEDHPLANTIRFSLLLSFK
ncbi:MAG: type IX secretion system outer membrane channel protein PorV [Bacteroidota bacterium]